MAVAVLSPEERRAKHAAYMREWKQRNPEKARVIAARYRAAHREQQRLKTAAFRAANPDYMQQWSLRNVEKRRAYRRARREVIGDQLREARRAWWRGLTPEQRAERKAAAYARRLAANPERIRLLGRLAGSRRRARLAGGGGSHTIAEWRAVVAAQRGRCFYCERSVRLERDHVVPIARGGSDSIDNIVGACRSCNAKKATRPVSEWRVAS